MNEEKQLVAAFLLNLLSTLKGRQAAPVDVEKLFSHGDGGPVCKHWSVCAPEMLVVKILSAGVLDLCPTCKRVFPPDSNLQRFINLLVLSLEALGWFLAPRPLTAALKCCF
ncbi:hypothetical protein JOB18_047902 [Solea senegalensis]|uniref:Uncharacterized protein n=1 Tax=Solea senegalensis TaxID=28829 RepID=A0AAV6Q5K5_SOLSE|nr:hypothetical protein JOB18_047902 [Solea senegalensis]